jgi:hypothetical protein
LVKALIRLDFRRFFVRKGKYAGGSLLSFLHIESAPFSFISPGNSWLGQIAVNQGSTLFLGLSNSPVPGQPA